MMESSHGDKKLNLLIFRWREWTKRRQKKRSKLASGEGDEAGINSRGALRGETRSEGRSQGTEGRDQCLRSCWRHEGDTREVLLKSLESWHITLSVTWDV